MPVEGSIGFGEGDGSFGTSAVDLLAASGARRRTENFRFDQGFPAILSEIDFDPGVAGVNWTQAALRNYSKASKRWLLTGTNAATALATAHVNGGWTLTTAGANNDQMILSPLIINGVYQGVLGRTIWRPDYALVWRALVTMGSSIADMRFIAGMKLTASVERQESATIADANHVLFAYDTGHTSNTGLWHLVAGNATVDENTAADSLRGPSTVRASTQYLLEIVVNASLQPVFLINGVNVGQLSAMISGSVLLIPVFGLQALTAAAKSVTLEDGEVSMRV